MQPTSATTRKSATVVHATVPALMANGSMVHTTARGQQMLENKMQIIKEQKRGFTGMQNYEALKKDYSKSKLFEDWEFPADQDSVFVNKRHKQLVWKRPAELVTNPLFIEGGIDRTDIIQGSLGDCWLLAAIASLTCTQNLLQKVIPVNQNFQTDYKGMFLFHIWHFGKWVDVIVDDKLPTEDGKLVFLHSRAKNEFWGALLEKAYAKLYGSYEALMGGSIGEALEDFTGGICEVIDLPEIKDLQQLYNTLAKSFKHCSLMGASIKKEGSKIEERLKNGLVIGHAYSVTAIRDVKLKADNIKLVRLRNPWGDTEWNGAWCDGSTNWNQVSDADRKAMNLHAENDGEFWISISDFAREFTTLEICHLGPDSLAADNLDGKKRTSWATHAEYGSWRRNVNAGGCRNHLNTFWTNPQFTVQLTQCDEDRPDMCTLIIGLMQREKRALHVGSEEPDDLFTIGFMVYAIDAAAEKQLQNGFITKRFVETTRSEAKCDYSNARAVTARFHLKPGKYIIVATTYDPNEECDFMIRIYSEKKHEMHESDTDTKMAVVPAASAPRRSDGETATMRNAWKKVITKGTQMDAYELVEILKLVPEKFKEISTFTQFHPEVCRSMVALMDADNSGKLDFNEFILLWRLLMSWKDNFISYDADKSGLFNAYEFRSALNGIGYTVSNGVFNSIVMRYVNKQGQVSFEDYILCIIRLRTVFETYKAQKKTAAGNAEFSLDEFVKTMVYM